MTQAPLRMLVPLDGSPEAESVLPALMPLFRARQVRLTLLAVVPPDESAEPLQAYLGRVRKSLLLDGVASESKAEWGDAAREILWLGKAVRFDLVAMATHGRTGLRRVTLGSVTENVLRHSDVPVLAFRPGTKIGDWKRMVVGLDGSAAAETILGDATRLAKAMEATLHVLRVKTPPPLAETYHRVPFLYPEEDPQPYLDAIADKLATDGVLALPVPREGDASTEIAAYAREIGAGLIFLTTHGRTGLPRLFFGSVAETVLRTAPCPVLVRRVVSSAVAREPSPAGG